MQKSGDEGVILVSFGTVMGNIKENMLTLLANAFSRVPQKVIWKLDKGRLSALQTRSQHQAGKTSNLDFIVIRKL